MRVIGHLQQAVQHRPHLADLAVALVILLVTLLTTAAPDQLPDGVPSAWAALACGILLLRRRWPYAVLVVSTIAAEAHLAGNHGRGGTLILAAPLFALYTVADLSDRRRALLVSGLVVAAVGALHTVGIPARRLGPENLALAALGGLAVAAGTASRHRRAYLAEVVRRAEDAERDRDADSRRRLTEERLRIARELHDSVGHHLALINVQAGVTGHLLTGAPEPVRETLAQIRQSSRAALDELRDSVGLLRRPGDAAPLQPGAGLTTLDDLLDTFRRAGLRITAHVDRPAALSWAADHTAYRVIQEALTNARKHAGSARVAVTLHHDGDALTVIVDNDGPPAGPAGDAYRPGHGIAGMRERVTALGGTLLAGPRPTGGFRVTAVIPAAP
ncbi:sensor histidine kinase [Actinoplanes nipponensis]|uniref:histidine kinase n=1 Tax=Actinoplanes nipponensis TaxID=135950 RepID=A0A919JBR4_9ACTN|nr:histidine kinase [Actinoplanes nipponensis]GIE47456.1 two-component sensor histidine kinase [Actinoplanes nipponensis]